MSGRGGWSWYTGAAAWLHRAAIESIFGLHQERTRTVRSRRACRSHWPRAELRLRRDGRTMRFVFVRGEPKAAVEALRVETPLAQALAPGQRLAWLELPEQSVFIVRLPDRSVDLGAAAEDALAGAGALADARSPAALP